MSTQRDEGTDEQTGRADDKAPAYGDRHQGWPKRHRTAKERRRGRPKIKVSRSEKIGWGR
jgi:hypothetical protein